MLQVVFSDSAAGSLKAAQSFGRGKYIGGAIGMIGGDAEDLRRAEEKMRDDWDAAEPLGGNTADILCFPLALSLGDIRDDSPASRLPVLRQLFGFYPGDIADAADEIIAGAEASLQKLRTRGLTEPIRVWYSPRQPDDFCGLCWLMAQLSALPRHGPVKFIAVPQWQAAENTVTEYRDCAELEPKKWSRYLPLTETLPPVMLRFYASKWRALQKENAPLRAVISGQLVGVALSFYDAFILSEIEKEPEVFREAMVIGRTLGLFPLGFSDGFVALRIEEMIRAGALEIVSPAEEDMPLYHRMLRKRSKTI